MLYMIPEILNHDTPVIDEIPEKTPEEEAFQTAMAEAVAAEPESPEC
jgi:hypothetical protein